MSDWIDIDDNFKPDIGQYCYILIPVGSQYVTESAEYIGAGVWIGAWCDSRGNGCSYRVDYWMLRPEQPTP